MACPASPERIAIEGGFAEVNDRGLTVLAERAGRPGLRLFTALRRPALSALQKLGGSLRIITIALGALAAFSAAPVAAETRAATGAPSRSLTLWRKPLRFAKPRCSRGACNSPEHDHLHARPEGCRQRAASFGAAGACEAIRCHPADGPVRHRRAAP
jgi:hypothetical protein